MTEIEQLLRPRVQAVHREDRLPGLTVGVAHQGRLLGLEFAGLAQVRDRRAVDARTQYRIGSITKTFTVALVLLLAERGLLDLDERVETYLPGTVSGARGCGRCSPTAAGCNARRRCRCGRRCRAPTRANCWQP